MDSTTAQNMCWGVHKTPSTITWGYTRHRRNGPGQSCKLVDRQCAVTSQTHAPFDARVRCSTQHPKCTTFRIPSHTSQQERIKPAQDHGLGLLGAGVHFPKSFKKFDALAIGKRNIPKYPVPEGWVKEISRNIACQRAGPPQIFPKHLILVRVGMVIFYVS